MEPGEKTGAGAAYPATSKTGISAYAHFAIDPGNGQ